MDAIKESPLPNLVYRGKGRDTHTLNDHLFLMVATDRISAFDVVLPTAIPDKGAVLCQISAFWFDNTEDVVPNHFVSMATDNPELDIPLHRVNLRHEEIAGCPLFRFHHPFRRPARCGGHGGSDCHGCRDCGNEEGRQCR